MVNPKTAAAPRLHPEGFRVQSMLLCACGTGQTSEDAGLRPQFYGLSRREALQVEGLQANSATLTILLCTTSFFPGGSVRFLKNTIFQKSSRQWVRVPGHDMGPGIKYHGPDFFFLKAS